MNLAFSNNQIPMNRQSSIARQIQGLLPLPNLAGNSNNFFGLSPLVFDKDLTPSQVVRQLIREYLTQHGVSFTPSGARPAVAEARSKRRAVPSAKQRPPR